MIKYVGFGSARVFEGRIHKSVVVDSMEWGIALMPDDNG
jgi:hypothetical protein